MGRIVALGRGRAIVWPNSCWAALPRLHHQVVEVLNAHSFPVRLHLLWAYDFVN